MKSVLINHITKLIKNYSRYFCASNRVNKHNLKPPWSVLFFGTDEFSVASLKALHVEYKKGDMLSKLEVVTNLKNKKNIVEQFALKENLVIHNWPVLPTECENFDIGLVVSFGHLIPQNIIDRFPLGILNVHASLLPRWRGAAPIIYAIANGDKKTGVSIMKIEPSKFDIGEIVSQTSVDIPDNMDMRELYNILADTGAQTLIRTFENLLHNLNSAKPQPKSGISFAPRVNSKMACIDWNKMTARDVYNLQRALTGLFHLTTKFNDIPVKLYNITECNRISMNTGKCEAQVPGFVVYNKESKTLQIKCADGNCVAVEKIGVPGKKMSAVDFNNGFLNKQIQHLRIFR